MAAQSSIGWIIAVVLISAGAPAAADPQHGVFTYRSAQACIADGKAPRDVCSYAAMNAAAEFEEKAPHFPSRAACEQVYRRNACAISFRQGAIGAGARRAVTFTPRQEGFRLILRSDHDISTLPISPGLNFSNRTALHQAASIDPRAAGQAASRSGSTAGAAFGVPEAGGAKGPLPPPVPFDPNFDCSKYIEPSSKGDVESACAPVPNWGR